LIEPGGRIDATRFGAPEARAQTALNSPLALDWARKTRSNIINNITAISSGNAAVMLLCCGTRVSDHAADDDDDGGDHDRRHRIGASHSPDCQNPA
jgi:hypothetical protein